MKLTHSTRLRTILGLAFLFLIICSTSSAFDETSPPPPVQSFRNCTFSAVTAGSKYFSYKDKFTDDDSGCSINLNSLTSNSLGRMRAAILITKQKTGIEYAESFGFKKDKGGAWKFGGFSFGNPPYKFKNLAISQDTKSDDVTLIGRQTGSATSPQGDTYVFDGISIFRMTSSFAASIQLAFEPDTPATTRKAIEDDLIKIVESVHPTTTAPVSASSH